MMNEEMEDEVGRAEEDATRDTGSAWSAPFTEFQDMMDDVLDGFRSLAPGAHARHPRLELAETADAYLVWLDLPGVAQEDLEVSARADELTVVGQRRRPEIPEDAQVRRSERVYGRFRRVVRLPAYVDASGVRARLEAGVLQVTVPRRVESEGHRVDVETD
jgi:HSP20 family protein